MSDASLTLARNSKEWMWKYNNKWIASRWDTILMLSNLYVSAGRNNDATLCERERVTTNGHGMCATLHHRKFIRVVWVHCACIEGDGGAAIMRSIWNNNKNYSEHSAHIVKVFLIFLFFHFHFCFFSANSCRRSATETCARRARTRSSFKK